MIALFDLSNRIDLCGSGGFLLGSSTETHPACKLENVVAMIETAKTTFVSPSH